MSEIEIAYRESPLSHGPGAGARWPPEAYAGLPPGAGGEPRFVLYAADMRRGAALTRRFPRLLEPAPRPSPERSDLVIVRPDGYVALAAREAAWDDAERYLSTLARADERGTGAIS